jgi:hypothetical protein
MPEELANAELVTARVAQVRRLVKRRLTGEINTGTCDMPSCSTPVGWPVSEMKPEIAYAAPATSNADWTNVSRNWIRTRTDRPAA